MRGQSVERGGVFKVAGIDKWVLSLSHTMVGVNEEQFVVSGKLLKSAISRKFDNKSCRQRNLDFIKDKNVAG